MITGNSFAGYYAAYSPHNQEQSPHILRLKQPLFTAPGPSIHRRFCKDYEGSCPRRQLTEYEKHAMM
jgi:hypothetical protein